MTQYRHLDTKRTEGIYVSFERIETPDDATSPEDFECYDAADKKAFHRGEWGFIGIQARAHILIVRKGGHGVTHTMTSAGLWGIESNSGEYLAEVFEEQKAELLVDLKALGSMPIVLI